jgi:hypothetical protein
MDTVLLHLFSIYGLILLLTEVVSCAEVFIVRGIFYFGFFVKLLFFEKGEIYT